MSKRKPKLRLIEKSQNKDCDRAVIVTCDDRQFIFKLDEWELFEDYDWIEVQKLDKTSMMYFYCSNIMYILFDKSNVKSIDGYKPELKPIA
jgi:hypothetical protein